MVPWPRSGCQTVEEMALEHYTVGDEEVVETPLELRDMTSVAAVEEMGLWRPRRYGAPRAVQETSL